MNDMEKMSGHNIIRYKSKIKMCWKTILTTLVDMSVAARARDSTTMREPETPQRTAVMYTSHSGIHVSEEIVVARRPTTMPTTRLDCWSTEMSVSAFTISHTGSILWCAHHGTVLK